MAVDFCLYCVESGETLSLPRVSRPGLARDTWCLFENAARYQHDFVRDAYVVDASTFDKGRLCAIEQHAEEGIESDEDLSLWSDFEDWCRERWKAGRTVIGFADNSIAHAHFILNLWKR